MVIETWRWRLVMFALGLVLLGTGGYCLVHPGEVPLNICYSETSRFLQSLNTVASFAAFLTITAAGGAIIFLVGYSIKERLAVKEDKKPIEYRRILVTVLANLALVLALAACALLAQWLLKGTSLSP